MQVPLLEEHFELAASFGITRVLLHSRYYQRGWSLERATTEPVNKKVPSEHASYIDVAQEHGITRSTYLTRVREGYTKEEASTKPAAKRGRPKGTHRTCRPYTDEQLALANSRGISRQMLNGRLKRGWHLERALTANHCEEWIRNHGERAELFVSKKQRAPRKKNPPKEKRIPKVKLYTKEEQAIANSNGISTDALQKRLRRNWDMERATTERINQKALPV